MPDYSQDGQVIAYMSDEFGTWDIFVTDKNATFQNRVTTNFANDEAPTFDKMQLPGTYRIYWSSNRAGGGDYNIYWINPMIQESGSNKPVWQGALNAPGFDGYPSSSYYNNGIAWMSSRDGDPEIFYYQTGYEKPMQLTNNTFETDTFPAMSPDGSFMAFQSDREDYNIDIWVMTFEGKNPHRFVDGINPDLDPFYASVDSN
jgi:Tol biopolymer transport system component